MRCCTARMLTALAFAGQAMAEYPASWDVIFTPTTPLPVNYTFGRQTEILKQNTTFPPAALPLPCDIVYDRDVPITLRDGTVIYTDLFRPVLDGKYPALVALSAYGKTVPTLPQVDVPADWFSGIAKNESADAAAFVCRGYAIVSPDNRGAGRSEGNIHFWGRVDAEDGYDIIEWTAQQPWSSGKTALYGASWLATSQWFVAALQPPHLTAIVPWNGLSDMYRDSLVWGGIPDVDFAASIIKDLRGTNTIERPDLMAHQYPLINAYWEDKSAQLENITVPAYVVADGLSILHSLGAVEGFRRISSNNKWLRIDDTQEWYDMYAPQNERDVLQFLDHYLKDVNNGWQQTPRVRAAVVDAGGSNQQYYYFTDWPIPETRYEKLYLDAESQSMHNGTAATSSISYNATTEEANFTFTFPSDTLLIGYFSLRLYVEADGNDDLDLFVTAEKLDAQDNLLPPEPGCTPDIFEGCLNAIGDTVPPGAPGRLRVSLRELEQNISTPFLPVQSFTQSQKLSPGEIVPVDLALVPRSYYFHAGQKLRLRVSGYNVEYSIPTINKGRHIIHTGGQYPSYIQLPVIPF